jgi:hypothetical protein
MIKELGDFSSGEETEGVEVKESDIGKVSSSSMEKGVWINQKRVPIQIPIDCHVPHKIQIVMRSIEHLMVNTGMGSLEFGIFLSGKLSDDGKLVLTEDFYVPQQKVSGAAIDFEEEPPEAKYNGVIHRHPNGCKGFSGTDSTFINRNFDFSLLYVDNDITTGILNLTIGELRYQVQIKPQIMYPIYGIDKESIKSKIRRDETVYSSTGHHLVQGNHSNPIFADRRDVRSLLRDPECGEHPEFNLLGLADEEVEDTEELYMCKKCGEIQWIELGTTIVCCESCEEILSIEDYDLVNKLNPRELDWSTREKIWKKQNEKD